MPPWTLSALASREAGEVDTKDTIQSFWSRMPNFEQYFAHQEYITLIPIVPRIDAALSGHPLRSLLLPHTAASVVISEPSTPSTVPRERSETPPAPPAPGAVTTTSCRKRLMDEPGAKPGTKPGAKPGVKARCAAAAAAKRQAANQSRREMRCSYEGCANPTTTSGAWKVITPHTAAGGRDVSAVVGRTFCHACWTQFRTKGSFERSYIYRAPARKEKPQEEDSQVTIVVDATCGRKRDYVVATGHADTDAADRGGLVGVRPIKRSRPALQPCPLLQGRVDDDASASPLLQWRSEDAAACAHVDASDDGEIGTGIPSGLGPDRHVYQSLRWRKDLERLLRERQGHKEQRREKKEEDRAAISRQASLRSRQPCRFVNQEEKSGVVRRRMGKRSTSGLDFKLLSTTGVRTSKA
eukprot:CAMPEP_0175901366 /NCGR_PEP_ID=MMETSP0108-20121206/2827_1 /TAXON_ID=195067 ORGANISM="Goniomonas pacifica, Strain CCMP1869" /NCGR_SAMPLE_ID=MMETSP0108 /ASSEMBLY_ACC=CAM_ASM_000204 /LENGTH=410 /DNA_ID=CAMNT_0017222951 /DNA_START=11 /DNA_END=1243 /DNA_ORIENTATION=-